MKIDARAIAWANLPLEEKVTCVLPCAAEYIGEAQR